MIKFSKLAAELARFKLPEEALQTLLARRGIKPVSNGYSSEPAWFDEETALPAMALDAAVLSEIMAAPERDARVNAFAAERPTGFTVEALALFYKPNALATPELMEALLERAGVPVEAGRFTELDAELLRGIGRDLVELAPLGESARQRFIAWTPGEDPAEVLTVILRNECGPQKEVETVRAWWARILQAAGIPVRNGRIPRRRYDCNVRAGLEDWVRQVARLAGQDSKIEEFLKPRPGHRRMA
jgi:hypothetical protein